MSTLRMLALLILLAPVVAVSATASDVRQPALTGIDVLTRDDFHSLQGRRVGLITNHTGFDRRGRTTIRLLHEAPGVKLVALFSPEHGLHGRLDIASIADSEDAATGIRIYSLYGETRRPLASMLEGVDTLVFDIQDIGTRFYTYISTLGLAMEAAAEQDLRFVVLDRPNPIGGERVSGPVADSGRESFTAFHRLPVRHGMTVGELARMFRAERVPDLDLEVVALENWRREDYFDAAGLLWVNPSPNMRSLTQALLYPGIGLLETTNLSVGRGTDTPFEVFGAPWLDGVEFAFTLNGLDLPGVAFVPVEFTPDASKFAGERCSGVNVIVTDRARFESVRTGVEIALALQRRYGGTWEIDAYDRLLVSAATLEAIRDVQPFADIQVHWQQELDDFRRRRAAFLLYE